MQARGPCKPGEPLGGVGMYVQTYILSTPPGERSVSPPETSAQKEDDIMSPGKSILSRMVPEIQC